MSVLLLEESLRIEIKSCKGGRSIGDYFQYISNLRICPNCGREACVEPHPQREDILIISCQNIECGYDFILVKEPEDFENIVVDTRKGGEVAKVVEGFLYSSTPDGVKEFLNYLSKQEESTKEALRDFACSGSS